MKEKIVNYVKNFDKKDDIQETENSKAQAKLQELANNGGQDEEEKEDDLDDFSDLK